MEGWGREDGRTEVRRWKDGGEKMERWSREDGRTEVRRWKDGAEKMEGRR